MDDYTIEEKDKEVTGITVMYDDFHLPRYVLSVMVMISSPCKIW